MSEEKREKRVSICLTDTEDAKVRRLAKKLNMEVSVFLLKAAINGIPNVLANKWNRRHELEDIEID